jgi:hypothetical protein
VTFLPESHHTRPMSPRLSGGANKSSAVHLNVDASLPQASRKQPASSIASCHRGVIIPGGLTAILRRGRPYESYAPRPHRRIFEASRSKLNASAFIVLTGNGLRISEDLARRFVAVNLDAKVEDPEARPFKGNVVDDVLTARRDLLCAALTIWHWGRQQAWIQGVL